MADRFAGEDNNIMGPLTNGLDITSAKSDTVDLATVTRAVIVGTDGNIAVILANGSAAVTIPVLAGVLYPFRIKRLMTTGTSATVIVGLT